MLGQVVALARAEWLRQLTTPVWALFLLLWALVAGLVLQLVLGHAAGNELPLGETATSYFFRVGNSMLALLLILFVPQLAVDAIAGRRESGRLEQLLIAGLRPGALALGAFLANALLLAVLALPLVVMHLALAGRLPTAIGHTLGGLAACLLGGACIASIGLAVSAWAPSRTTAALTTTAIGVLWWMSDHLPGAPLADAGLSLAATIRGFAGGLIDLPAVAGQLAICLAMLLIAAQGLRARGRPTPRLGAALATGCCLLALLGHTGRWSATWSLSATGGAALSEATHARVSELADAGGVDAVLVATPRMQQDAVDGPLCSALRAALRRLAADGLRWQSCDPDFDSARLLKLPALRALPASELSHPVLVLSHLDRQRVLTRAQLAQVTEEAGGERLAALTIDPALRQAVEELAGDLPRLAWLSTPDLRPRREAVPARRAQAVDAAARNCAAAGYQVVPCNNWAALDEHDWAVIALPGLRSDPAEAALATLARRLADGGRIWLALDGRRSEAQPRLETFLRHYGIVLDPGVLRPTRDRQTPPILSSSPTAETGPAAGVGHARELLRLPWNRPLRPGEPGAASWQVHAWLPVPQPVFLDREGGAPIPLRQERFIMIEARHPDGGRLLVSAGVDFCADGWLYEEGNERLLRGSLQWLGHAAEDAHPPPPGSDRLHLSRSDADALRWWLGLGLPLLALLVGVGTWWWRRH